MAKARSPQPTTPPEAVQAVAFAERTHKAMGIAIQRMKKALLGKAPDEPKDEGRAANG
jgi:hypothetical protein